MKRALLLLILLTGLISSAQSLQLNNYCGNNVFNLTDINGALLGNQNPAGFNITFHLSQSDAANFVNEIDLPTVYTATSSPQIVFARVFNFTSGNVSINPINLIVNSTLQVNIAINFNTSPRTLTANATGGQEPYTYAWSINGAPLAGVNSQQINLPNNQTGVNITSAVTVTDANGCSGSSTLTTTNSQSIIANDDNIILTNLSGTTPPGSNNVLSNDFVGGNPATINSASIVLISTTNEGVGLTSQGLVFANNQTPSGVYTLVYQICQWNNPNNCDMATVTVTVDFCRAAIPIIDSIAQPNCIGVQTGSINLSGLPEIGTWTITLSAQPLPLTYTGTGPTFSIQNLNPGTYSLNVIAEDILLVNCFESFPINFVINENSGLLFDMNGTYVDYNSNGLTDVGDVINYAFELTNNSCGTAFGVIVTSNELSVIGDSIELAPYETNQTAYSGVYVLTQQDINIGSVFKRATATGYLEDIYTTKQDSTTTNLNILDGIKLKAFLDYNNNGSQENTEPNFPYGEFHYSLNSGPTNNIATSNGIFYIYESNPINSYDLSYTLDSAYLAQYTVATSSYSNITVANGSGITEYSFPIIVTPYIDLSVQLLNYSAPPRPGFIYQNTIVYTNYGNTTIANGTITFVKDPLLTIINVSESGIVINANGFSFDFVNLPPGQSRQITVSMQVPTIPTVTLGQQVTNTTSITVVENEVNISNNSSSLTQTIVGSYDPNDKAESHGSNILFSSFSADDYLTYTIRFENTGTANAVNVKVDDILDIQLDENTVRTISASHPYILKRINNALSWKFDGIDLPPSIENDPITGHGYIVFQVKPKIGFALGDIIPNTAEIYFDFNPAIVTNTWTSEFVPFLGINIFENDTFEYYPNPTSDIVTFNLKNTSATIDSIEVMDVLGKRLLTKTNNYSNASIDLSSLSKGMYLVKVRAAGQEKTIKIVKN
jgi:uncharacterized repeat protein (TIGR01451 family)